MGVFEVAITALAVLMLGTLLIGPRLYRRGRKGGYEVALRVKDGTEHGFGRRWRYGLLTPTDHGASFLPGGPLGMRLPGGRERSLVVMSLDAGSPQSPPAHQVFRINPNYRVVTLSTRTGTLDLAVDPSAIPSIVDTIFPPTG